MNITVSDYAGVVDTITVESQKVYIKVATISANAYTTLNSSFTSSCVAGVPIQGGMRQLASDRWNYMYPS